MKLKTCIATGLCAVFGFAAPALAACDTKQPTRTPTDRYVISGGSVYDKKANLTWQRCSVGQSWAEGMGCTGAVKSMVWDDAMKEATGGWRLPSKDELETLMSPTCSYPSINEEAFPNMDLQKLGYWTGTQNDSSNAWQVGFSYGFSSYNSHRNTYAVRLVRSGK